MPTVPLRASKLECALTDVRAALREAAIDELARATVGGVIEIFQGLSGKPQAALWPTGASYARRDPPDILDMEDMERCDFSKVRAHLAVWLFGPERIARPALVSRWLYQALEPNSPIFVASETPWVGKELAPDEIAEQTKEELGAMLTRAGFGAFHHVVEGPVFRLWTAFTSPDVHHTVLMEAEDRLRTGDWILAQETLFDVNVALSTLAEVREYALLVAACHDLAGRTAQCLDALEETLLLDPTCTRAMCGIARIFALEGRFDSAAALFSAALDIEPACQAARCGLSAVENALRERDAATPQQIILSQGRPAPETSARA